MSSDPMTPTRNCAAARARRNHGMVGRSRLLPEDLASSNVDCGFPTTRRVTLFQFDLSLALQAFVRYLTDMGEAIMWFFADLRIAEEALRHFSYLSLSLHLLCHTDLTTVVHLLVPASALETTNSVLPIDWFLSVRVLLGIIPAIVLISSLVCVIALICKWSSTEAFILMSLVALFLVECLVPLTFTASSTLYLLQAISGPNAVAITVLVWLASITCSRVLRTVIYPSLGLD